MSGVVVHPINPMAVTGEERKLLHKSVTFDVTGSGVDYILRQAAAAQAQVWRVLTPAGGQAIIVTKVADHPAGRELRLWHVAGTPGTLQYFDEVMASIEHFARAMDCDWIYSISRRGMAKVMREHGWRHQASVMVKELNDG